MSKVIVHLQARMASSRLPNKAAYELGGKPAFVQILERIQEYVPDANHYFVVTTLDATDDPLALLAKAYGYEVFRWSEQPNIRCREFYRYLDLKDDDISILVPGDAPFILCEHLPFAIEKIRELGNRTRVLSEDGTVIWATTAVHPQPVGYYELLIQDAFRVRVGEHSMVSHHQPATFIKLPERFYKPWPWAPIILDYPLEGMQIKVIYNLLYRGKPIDVRDVYDLLVQRPHVANLVPRDIKRAEQIVYPYGSHGFDVIDIMNTTDSVVVEWEGGEADKE